MAEGVKHIEVMIVGAGPSGLMMAAQLLRFGVQPVIIDCKPGPDKQSKALAVQARSLELFRQMGLEEKLLAGGFPCYGLQVQRQKKVLGKVDFSEMNHSGTKFPYIHMLSQEKTERALIDRLTENACPIYWHTALTALNQNDQWATAETVRNGIAQKWTCKWVIGADGAKSAVRKMLHIPFSGKTYNADFFLADIKVDEIHNRNIHVFLSKNSFLGVFPIDKSGNYRLMGVLPEKASPAKGEVLTYASIEESVNESLGFELPVVRCHWINHFMLHKRMAAEFRLQRCFLIGDAAHIHSPVGGQGMNTGMQDAANLAWKLAAVLSNKMDSRILHTYQPERLPVAKAILANTDRIFGLAIEQNTWLYRLANWAIPRLTDFISKKTARLEGVFKHISQIATTYRSSPLSVHHSRLSTVKAGDRLPYLRVYDEKAKEQTDLHVWCQKPGFMLLIIGTIGSHDLQIIGRWVKQKYPRDMHLYYLPYSPKNREVFDTFEMKSTQTKMILVRPDMHIGYINDALNISLVETYMEEVLKWKT